MVKHPLRKLSYTGYNCWDTEGASCLPPPFHYPLARFLFLMHAIPPLPILSSLLYRPERCPSFETQLGGLDALLAGSGPQCLK